MKNLHSGVSNLLVFVILTGLVVAMIALFNNQSTPSAGLGSSPVPTVVGGQASPLATPVGSSVPLAKIGKPVLLTSVDRLGTLNGDQNKFASIVGEGASAQTIVLDPATGTAQTVTNTALMNAKASGHWLVYVDHPAFNAKPYYQRLKVLNLDNGQEIDLGDENSLQDDPYISGNIVVWDEPVNGRLSSIYGYDLVTGKKFPIVVKPGSRGHPRISGQWVTYVQWPEQTSREWQFAIELHAYSLKTGEDILIGVIPSPKDAGWGTQYALDEDKIVWNKYLESSGRRSELHLYDLTTRTDRKLAGPSDGWAYDLSISAESGVIAFPGGKGSVLDWRQPEAVYLSFDLPPRPAGASISGFRVFGDRLFWRVPLDREGSEVHLFTAPITR
jgi:hypothetical protein